MDPSLINALSNVGGVAILGLFLLKVLPKMITDFDDRHLKMIENILTDQAAERRANAVRLGGMVSSLDRMVDNMPHVCRAGRSETHVQEKLP